MSAAARSCKRLNYQREKKVIFEYLTSILTLLNLRYQQEWNLVPYSMNLYPLKV